MSESKQHYSDKSGGGHCRLRLIRRRHRPSHPSSGDHIPHHVDRLKHRLRRQVRVPESLWWLFGAGYLG